MTARSDAEKAAYARGYNAGRARKAKDVSREQIYAKTSANWNRAFLATLTTVCNARDWTRGKVPINDIPSRVLLAAEFADEAVKRMR